MMMVMVMKPREGFRPTSSAEKGPVPGPHPHLALSPPFWWCLQLSELLGWGVPPSLKTSQSTQSKEQGTFYPTWIPQMGGRGRLGSKSLSLEWGEGKGGSSTLVSLPTPSQFHLWDP